MKPKYEFLSGRKGVYALKLTGSGFGMGVTIWVQAGGEEVFNENTLKNPDDFVNEFSRQGQMSVSVWNKLVNDKNLIACDDWGDKGIWFNGGSDIQMLPLKNHKGVIYASPI